MKRLEKFLRMGLEDRIIRGNYILTGVLGWGTALLYDGRTKPLDAEYMRDITIVWSLIALYHHYRMWKIETDDTD